MKAKISSQATVQRMAREALEEQAYDTIERLQIAAQQKREFQQKIQKLHDRIEKEETVVKLEQEKLNQLIENTRLAGLAGSSVVSRKSSPKDSKRTSKSATPATKETGAKVSVPPIKSIGMKRSALPSENTRSKKSLKNDSEILAIREENQLLKSQLDIVLSKFNSLPDFQQIISKQNEQLNLQKQQIDQQNQLLILSQVPGKNRLLKKKINESDCEESDDDINTDINPSDIEFLDDFEKELQEETIQQDLDKIAKLIKYDRKLIYHDTKDIRSKFNDLFHQNSVTPEILKDAKKFLSGFFKQK